MRGPYGRENPGRVPGYSAPVREQKNRLIAGACSSVLPGLGQVYNGETAKGFAIFILTLAGLALLLIPGLIAWLYGIYNAYTTAGKMNTGEIPFRETRMLHVVLFIVFAVAVIADRAPGPHLPGYRSPDVTDGHARHRQFQPAAWFRRIDLTGADRNAGCVPRHFPERGHFSLPKTGISGRFISRFFKEGTCFPLGRALTPGIPCT